MRALPRGGPLALIGTASLLNVLSGVILKEAGQIGHLWLIPVAIGAAGAVNGLRFVLWRRAHRLFPLSLTYPLTGLTFPMALVASLLYGEPVGSIQVMATVLIAGGVAVIHRSGALP
jgi:multidrug transporter EmrE-like cation transporter